MNFFLPPAALNQHVAILGKTGSGKTWTAKTIVEHVLQQKRQVCVLDPTGAWYGLRLAADGKGRGFDVVLLGGQHADIPLAERSGAAVARLVTQQGASVVIDTSGFTVGEYTRWFIDFAGTLYTTIVNPLHLIIDEAHYFMPQGKSPDVDAGRMLHAGNRLMSGGRSKGIRGMLITQRPAKLHKDSLTCADTLIAMRVIAPQDRGAIKDWIDGAGDSALGKSVLDSLAQLKRGEGWVWYPEGGHLERVTFPPIRTYDSSATPTHGVKSGPKVSEINLSDVRAALAEAVAEAEANDPKKLRMKITELEKKLRQQPSAVADQAAIDRAVAERDREWKRAIQERDGVIDSLKVRMMKAAGILHVNGEATPKTNPVAVQPVAKPQARIVQPRREPTGDTTLNKAQQRILDALAFYESIGNTNPTTIQVGAMAQIDPTGGYFSNLTGPLSSEGMIERGNGTMRLTDIGRAQSQPMQHVGTLADYHDVLKARIRKMKSAGGKTIEMLNEIIRAGGDNLTSEQLGQAVGIDHTGGYFSNMIGPLGTVGIIRRERGVIVPTEILFPEGM